MAGPQQRQVRKAPIFWIW